MVAPSRTGSNQLNASAGNLSTSATVPSGTNLAVAFWSHWDGNGGTSASSLSINGVAMTIVSQLAEGATSDENGVGVAYLVSPATGSQTHALTWSGGGARTEGGPVVFVYYQDGNTSDPYRAAGTNAATGSGTANVDLASTVSTDRVVGYAQSYQPTTWPAITGVTAFITDGLINTHGYDVGDDTGLTGTVTIGNSTPAYSSAAGISLKEAVAASDPYRRLAIVAQQAVQRSSFH